MTLQHSPKNAQNDLSQYLDQVDNATNLSQYGNAPTPAFGDQHRSAINACVEGLVNDNVEKIHELKKVLDRIEQQIIQSAARCKQGLDGHVAICVRMHDEILNIQDVIADLADKVHDA